MFKVTRHHFNLKNWIDDLKKNIEHSRHLVDTYPNDPRCMQEVSMLNVYEKLYNLLTGSDDVSILNEDYQVMIRIGKEGMTMSSKFKKTDVEKASEDVVISQTQIASAPELAQIDAEHAQEMEALDVKKKTRKSKSK